MLPSFEKTVDCLADSFMRRWAEAAAATDQRQTVVRFVKEQHGRMPDFLRFPLRCLTLAFDAAAIFRTGRFFHSLPPERRGPIIVRWEGSRLGPCRDLMRFYQTLTIFAWSSGADER